MQINLNHCEMAQELAIQSANEREIDVLVISEPYNIPDWDGRWVKDRSGKAAIYNCGQRAFQSVESACYRGFIYAKIDGIHYYSCYAPPNESLEEFKTMLDCLVTDARQKSPLIIAGDFNAWAVAWGSTRTNSRGFALLEALATLDLVLLNDNNSHTFDNGRFISSIDLTFASGVLARNIRWNVSDIYTGSDHLAIIFELNQSSGRNMTRPIRKAQPISWCYRKLDVEMLEYLAGEVRVCEGSAEAKAKNLMQAVKTICDASMPRRGMRKYQESAAWWNADIARLRKDCHRLHRIQQRARGRDTYEQLNINYKQKRKELKKAISRSKEQLYESLTAEAKRNPWGRAYQIIKTKMKGKSPPSPSCPLFLQEIVRNLFPYQNTETAVRQENQSGIPDVAESEVLAAVDSIKVNKSPGVDGIPNIALKLIIKKRLDLFADLYTACLKEQIFPKVWKIQRLVLIPKKGKPLHEPSSYRPLCMLDTAGKILEKIIVARLEQYTEGPNGLSNYQYGFRKQRSTIDAIEKVTNIAKAALEGTRWRGGDKEYCAVVTLDVKNAFNSAKWDATIRALIGIGASPYLVNIINSYFSERILTYDTDDGPKRYTVTAGVPQGSVLGPTLWNIMYNGVFNVDKPSSVEIIGYADDIAITVVSKHLNDLKAKCNRVVSNVQSWLQTMGLVLAESKTEVVLFSSRKRIEKIDIRVGNQIITSCSNLRYLGVLLDHRLNFRDHLSAAGDKALRVSTAVARLMPNVRGPKHAARTLLASVSTSVMMYGSPIWYDATRFKSYTKTMIAAHRLGSLRICCAFRTVSEAASNVISGRAPVDLHAKKLAALRDLRLQNCYDRDHIEAVEYEILTQWQQRWVTSTKGRWTYTLIPVIQVWINRKYGSPNYYLTQFLTGHGCFREYLHKYKHVENPLCLYCDGASENVEHVFTACRRFDVARRALENIMGEEVTCSGIIRHMLAAKDSWDQINYIVSEIMQQLRRDEQAQRREINN